MMEHLTASGALQLISIWVFPLYPLLGSWETLARFHPIGTGIELKTDWP